MFTRLCEQDGVRFKNTWCAIDFCLPEHTMPTCFDGDDVALGTDKGPRVL